MAKLSQQELKDLYNSEENAVEEKPELSQDELKRLYNQKDPSIADSFVTGGLNQFNLLSKLMGGLSSLQSDSLNDRWGAKKIAPTGVDEEKWKNASTSERYKLAKDVAQENVDRIEDANPIASTLGNIAGGMVLPSGGGIATGIAGKLGAKGLTKLGANLVGNAGEGALQSLAFANEGEGGKSALMGASLGSAIPLAGEGIKALIKGGKVAKKYLSRVDDIKAQRESGISTVERLEQEANDQIAKVQQEAEDSAIKFTDDLQNQVRKSIERSQVLDQNLINKAYNLNKEQLNIMGKESTLGWDKLSNEKNIDVSAMADELKNAISRLDPKDPNIPRLQKWVNDLEKDKIRMAEIETQLANMEKADPLFGIKDPAYEALEKEYKQLQKSNDKISEVDLKKKLNTFRNEIKESESRDKSKGIWIPQSSRELMKVASIGREILVNNNKAYADIVKPLSEKVEKIKKINETLNFGGDAESTLKTLKAYKSEKSIRDALDEYKKITGEDLTPFIDEIEGIFSTATAKSLNKEGLDLVDVIVNTKSSNGRYKTLENDLVKFDEKNGTNYAQQLKDLRTNNMVDLLNKAKMYTASKEGGSGESMLSKFAYNVLPEGIEKPSNKENVFDRVLSPNKLQNKLKRSKKDKKSRQMIEDLSRFIAKDSDNVDDVIAKNTRAMENDVLYDLMGNSSTNGSRRVNLGANLGEWLHEGLKAFGSGIGALIDNGIAQRTRRELLEGLYQLEKSGRINAVDEGIRRLGTKVVAPQVSKGMANEEQSLQAWDDMWDKKNRVDRQKDVNLQFFKRTGNGS